MAINNNKLLPSTWQLCDWIKIWI